MGKITKETDQRKRVMKRLDKVFSRVLRLERSQNGLVQCFTCGRWLPINEATVGHFIKRQYIGTRYNEINCQIQCRKCNYLLQGNDVEFAKRLQEKYGEQIIEKLKLWSKQKIPAWKLELLLKHYTERLEKLKGGKDGKVES